MSNDETTSHGAGSTINLVSVLEVLWRYRLLVAICGFGLAAIATYLALTTEFVYRAEVVITPVRQDDGNDLGGLASRIGGLASLAGINLQGNSSGPEALAMLRSRHLAETFIARGKLTRQILRNARKQSLWLAVDQFRRTVVVVRQDKENGTTIVSVQWRDPKEAALWANQYVALANEILRNRALEDASRNIKYLNEQINKTQVVDIQRVMYGLVENETKKQMLASTRAEYAFTVVDPAVTPEERIWPRRAIMVLSGGVLGGILGALIALGHNLWRNYGKKRSA
ncbi:MAG TPA: Wzz/FepE/Etk N-terminal domain-containing protein [Steroidobacteraceae bacterium]|nr:Wzz/FepE/Etk N-terminal domain-containing protein [Steroidobacteraceae bacterium]